MRFDEYFLRGALPEAVIVYNKFPEHLSFSIDSRTIKPGEIFIALQGTQCDGHDFLADALKKGAAGLIIAADKKDCLALLNNKEIENKLVVLVPNPLQALVRFAEVWRLQFDYPVVAITGSVGKTSTKEILANILTINGDNYLASYGNQNTKIGISLNMLKMRSDHQKAIFEVGINKRGEMAELVALLKPTTAAITCIGHSHMEGLGSLVDIALEKRDIFKFFTEDSIGIINGDQSILTNIGYVHPVIKFGSKTINQIQARKIRVSDSQISFVLKIYKEKFPIVLKHTHAGAVGNSLAAVACAYLLDVPSDKIVQGIQMPCIIAGRFESKPLKSAKGAIINDCYNANPESMKASLLSFQHIETKAQKIAVLGDMLELGVNSPFWHRQLGRFLRKISSVGYVILVGDMVKWTEKTVPVGLKYVIVPTWNDAVRQLEAKLKDTNESLVLVKGSQGTGLGNLVRQFTE